MKPLYLVIAVMAVFYFMAFRASSDGYGYAGHGGYHHGPSFWYWGGVRHYPMPTTRTGSPGGPTHRGGGPRGGK